MSRVLRVGAGIAGAIFLLVAALNVLPLLWRNVPDVTYGVAGKDAYFVFDWISALLYVIFAGAVILVLLALARIIDRLEGDRPAGSGSRSGGDRA